MPAAPRKYLIEVFRRLPAAVVCHRLLGRGAKAVACGTVPFGSQVLDRGADAVARVART
jgi:hypothetical protein